MTADQRHLGHLQYRDCLYSPAVSRSYCFARLLALLILDMDYNKHSEEDFAERFQYNKHQGTENSNGDESRTSKDTHPPIHENLDETWDLLKDTKRRRRFTDNRVIITQHFTERTLTPGGDVSMQCTAIGDRPPQFTWHRDGVAISSSTDTR
ncbi:uncharacterized protein LOC123703009 [Colias croceus]|uniref:uncharacterized protein LOC123703009 n=1 Tax=Colias crocea TaxID=72248 RepID=UPI001E280E47|nr:uncharacterized protein LOC123703009 [Colias croceus]